jgi:hypothetical protein
VVRFLGPASLCEGERNWVDPRTDVDDVKDGEIYCPYKKSNPSFSVAQLIKWWYAPSFTEKRGAEVRPPLLLTSHFGRDNSRWAIPVLPHWAFVATSRVNFTFTVYSRWRKEHRFAMTITFWKSNKNSPMPEQMLKLLPSWPDALSIPAEHVSCLVFFRGNCWNLVAFVSKFFQSVETGFIRFIF